MKYILTILIGFVIFAAIAQKKTYEYDDLNRLSKAHYWEGSSIKATVTYTYDEVGNRLSKTVTIICNNPTATLSGTQTINEGQSASLAVAFTGDIPYNFTANGQAYSNITTTPYNFSVSPIATTTYSINQIANNCGVGTANGSAVVTVIPACQQPDLIISDVIITKYSSNRVDYRVVVKNVGNQTVNLGSFAFSTYGSTDATKDNADTFKSAMFLGGGNLAKNQTINYDVFASINYNSPEHYFVLLADHYASIAECDENNNTFGKIVKPCTNANNATLTGTYGPGLIAANGYLTLNNVTANANTLFTGASITGNPKINASTNNVSLVVGTCVNLGGFLPNNAIQNTSNVRINAPKQLDAIEFLESKDSQQLSFKSNTESAVTITIWDMASKQKIKEESVSKYQGVQNLDFAKYNLVKGKTYIVHFETESGHFAKVVEW